MTNSPSVNSNQQQLDVLALGPSPTPSNGKGRTSGGAGSWFEAVAEAWGSTLDNEAQKITSMSDQIGDGNEQPSQLAMLSAESMRMNFMANSEQTSTSSIGQSLETMARKS